MGGEFSACILHFFRPLFEQNFFCKCMNLFLCLFARIVQSPFTLICWFSPSHIAFLMVRYDIRTCIGQAKPAGSFQASLCLSNFCCVSKKEPVDRLVYRDSASNFKNLNRRERRNIILWSLRLIPPEQRQSGKGKKHVFIQTINYQLKKNNCPSYFS